MEQYTYLAHHGIKGQKWYHRRFQNEDGSLTSLGRERYGVGNILKKAATSARVTGLVAKGRASRALESGMKKASTSARVAGIIAKGRTARALDRSGVANAAESARRSLTRGLVAANNAKSSLSRALSTQSYEAERLRRYTDGLVKQRIMQTSLKSLALQKDYARRKEAAKEFIREISVASSNAGYASTHRFNARRGRRIAGEISADLYKFLTRKEGLGAKEAVSEMVKGISESNSDWRRSVRNSMNQAEKWRSIARGH